MPITVVGTGAQVNGTTASVNVAWPAGYTVGDFALLLMETTGNSTATHAPAGWTAVPGTPYFDLATTAGARLIALYRFVDSATMANVATGTPTDHVTARITVFRGVDPTTPLDATPVLSRTTTASATQIMPAITTATANACIVSVATRPNDSASTTSFGVLTPPNGSPLTNVTPIVENGTTNGNGGGFVIGCAYMPIPGSTGTATRSQTTSTTNANLTIALRQYVEPIVTTGTGSVSFGVGTNPGRTDLHEVRLGGWRNTTGTGGTLTYSLRQGATIIASWTGTLTAVAQDFTQTLTSAQAGALNWSLALELHWSATATGTLTLEGQRAAFSYPAALVTSVTHSILASGASFTAGTADTAQPPVTLSALGVSSSVGSAALQRHITLATSGSSVSTGSSALQRHITLATSGSSVSTGSAVLQGLVTVVASGSSATTGSAVSQRHIRLDIFGSSVSTGSAALQRHTVLDAFGSSVSNGVATAQQQLSLSAEGLSSSAGQVALRQLGVVTALGVSTSGGSATITRLGTVLPPTALSLTIEGTTSVRLTWTASASEDVVRYVIRRTSGATPPASSDDGVLVADLGPVLDTVEAYA